MLFVVCLFRSDFSVLQVPVYKNLKSVGGFNFFLKTVSSRSIYITKIQCISGGSIGKAEALMKTFLLNLSRNNVVGINKEAKHCFDWLFYRFAKRCYIWLRAIMERRFNI